VIRLLSWIFTGLIGFSLFASILLGKGAELAVAVPQGAQAGVTLVISMAGSICLWSGIGRLMDKVGFTGLLAKLLKPLLRRIFPGTQKDPELSQSLSANICANFLGLGNAATPMGIQAAQRLAKHSGGIASDELCRLIVLNTASIQLIPANVAAVRAGLGCQTPFDILPAVWVTSLCSASLGLCAAWLFGKVWRR
jgi:spore maturation protein A